MTDDIHTYCQQFARTIGSDVDEYLGTFFDSDHGFRVALAQFFGVKTDLHFDFSETSGILLRISLVMSDVTSVFMEGGEERAFVGATAKSPLWPLHVRAPVDLIEKHSILTNNGLPVLSPGASMRSDAQAIGFLNEVQPLIEAGLLVPRPNIMLLALTHTADDEGHRQWQVIDVDPNNPASIWIAAPPRPTESSLPLYAESHRTDVWQQIAKITVPYIQHVSLRDLAKILVDEHDLLAEFRRNVRQLINGASESPSEVRDIYNDGVRPATDKVNRRFHDIVADRAIRMAGAVVSSAGLGLLSVCGIDAVNSALWLGAGGLSMLLAREYAEFVREKRELRSEPFYLLWKIQERTKARKTT